VFLLTEIILDAVDSSSECKSDSRPQYPVLFIRNQTD